MNRYVSRKVLSVLSNKEEADQLVSKLNKSKLYEQDDFGTIALIDACGYSHLTSSLAPLGQLSSEVLTLTVGSLVAQIVDLVNQYGGDVIKFDGDAVLVNFSTTQNQADNSEIAYRAFSCCQMILKTFSTVEYDIATQMPWANIPTNVKTKFELNIHVAMVSGSIKHLFLGNHSRIDYGVFGDCFKELSVLLDSAQPGELAVDTTTLSLLKISGVTKYFNRQRVRDNVVFSWTALNNGEEGSDEATAIENLYKPADTQAEWNYNISDPTLIAKFINQSLLLKVSTQSKVINESTPYASRQRGTVKLKATLLSINQPDVGFDEEFRTVSIIFVRLHHQNDFNKAQQAMALFLDCLDKHKGIFHQFAVGEKGQVMMACVGLPPLSHTNSADSAIRIAIDFINCMKSVGSTDVTISTGELLFTTIGNKDRSAPALSGEIVTVAKHILNIQSDEFRIFCDENTFNMASVATRSALRSIGEVKIKGKPESIKIWGVGTTIQKSETQYFGYKGERAHILTTICQWQEQKTRQVIVIEGQSGVGKSHLVKYCIDIMAEKNCFHSLVQVSEVRQNRHVVLVTQMITKFVSPLSTMAQLLTKLWQSWSLPNLPKTNSNTTKSGNLHNSSQYKSLLSVDSSTDLRTSVVNTKELEEIFHQFAVPIKHLPLMKEVFPSLKIEENEDTRSLNALARQSLLESAIFDIICGFSAKMGLAIIIDDTQWMDTASLQMLGRLTANAENVCFVIFSRPIVDHNLEILADITKSPSVIHINLKGLSLKDTGDWIVRSKLQIAVFIIGLQLNHFQPMGVSSVSPLISKEIHTRGLGSPLFIALVLESLQSYNSSHIIISQKGCLQFQPGLTSFGDALIDIVKRSITMQFDKLNPNFQILIRVASVFGQYFNLQYLQQVLKLELGSELTVADLADMIKKHDSFNFLVEQESASEEPNYFFRHVSICETIYQLLPHTRRVDLHLAVAETIEGGVDEANTSSKVPLLSYHFLRCDDIGKALKYTELLGTTCLEKGMYKDSIKAFLKVVDIMNGDHEHKSSIPELITDERRAYIFGSLAWSYAYWQKPVECRDAARKSLVLLGFKLPVEGKPPTRLLLEAVVKHVYLWCLTQGGRVRPSVWTLQFASYYSNKAVARALMSIVFTAAFDSTQSTAETSVAMIRLLNFELMYAVDNPSDWIQGCCRASHILSTMLTPLHKIYWFQATSLLTELNLIGDSTIGMAYVFAGMCAASRTEIEIALRFLEEGISISKNTGMVNYAFIGQGTVSAISAFRCDFNYLFNTMIPEVTKMTKLDKLDAVYSNLVPSFKALYFVLKGDAKEALRYGEEAEVGLNQIRGRHIFSAISGIATIYSCVINDHEMALQHFCNYVDILLTQGKRFVFIIVGFACLSSLMVSLLNSESQARSNKVSHGRWQNRNKEFDVSKGWRPLVLEKIGLVRKWFWKRRKYITFATIVVKMIDASVESFQGRNDRASKILRRGLKTDEQSDLLESLPLIQAIYYGQLAKSTSQQREKFEYEKRAYDLLLKSHSSFLISWLQT